MECRYNAYMYSLQTNNASGATVEWKQNIVNHKTVIKDNGIPRADRTTPLHTDLNKTAPLVWLTTRELNSSEETRHQSTKHVTTTCANLRNLVLA